MTDRMEPKHKLTVKVGDALRTIQGYTLEEYLEARTELLSELAGDAEAVAMARAAGSAAPLIAASAPAVASAPPGALADNPWPAAPPVFAAAAATVPTGPDGQPRVAKSGKHDKGPWKAWFTAPKKGEPGYAEPIWVTRGTPEWNNFPA
jgi:hypothetical protein